MEKKKILPISRTVGGNDLQTLRFARIKVDIIDDKYKLRTLTFSGIQFVVPKK